ncbi:MAG: hypothetical protein ACOYOL_02125 [Chthoniobacterales bacterium]
MKTASALLLGLMLPAAPLLALDQIHLQNGTVREGKITGIEQNSFRLSLPPPLPGQPAPTTTIPRADVTKIVFDPDPVLEAMAKNISLSSMASARVRWEALAPLLAMPESRAAQAGSILGEILLLSPDRARHEEALTIYQRIETDAWNPTDREAAKRGRLRAMLRLGRLEEASAEAEQIAATAEDPNLLIDTKLLLAQARLATLRQLLAENPRWYEDPPIKSERDKLLNDGLEFALYPFLFHGTARTEAAKGLWLAHAFYESSGDQADSAEVCRDLTEIYADTPEAKQAESFLTSAKAAKEPDTQPTTE